MSGKLKALRIFFDPNGKSTKFSSFFDVNCCLEALSVRSRKSNSKKKFPFSLIASSLVPSTDQVPQQQPLISPSSTSQMLRNNSSSEFQDHHRVNFNFMRKIPPGAEASNILVGEVDFLTKTLSAFIRLSSAAIMGDLTEVPVPTRFEKLIETTRRTC